MRFKRFIYSLLLVLFALVLLADLGLWFLVPETEAADGENGGFSFTPPEGFPEGMSLPEGVTLPEGFPEGMTLPEGMSLPEGGTFPGPGEGNEGSSRPRRDRSKSNEQTSSAEAADAAIGTLEYRRLREADLL